MICSFCGKSQDEVKVLICGPVVYICDECVMLCVNVLVYDFPKEKSFGKEPKKERNDLL